MIDADGVLERSVAAVFLPALNFTGRYEGFWGGRNGAKSHFLAEQTVLDAVSHRGFAQVCIREIQKSLRDSSKRLLESKIRGFGLTEADGFKVFSDVIETPGDGLIIFTGMQDHTAESIKSLEGFDRAWWDEAQKASATSLGLLRPTIRAKGSKLRFSWNPKTPPNLEQPLDSVDGIFRVIDPATLPGGGICIESQFYDNPWLTDEQRKEEAFDRARLKPERYQHIWRGAYDIRSEAQVFSNWIVEDFDTPAGANFRMGADFGFSVDPSVLVRMFIGRWEPAGDGKRMAVPDDNGRTLFIDHEAYRVGCDVDHTAALFAGEAPAGEWKNPYGDTGVPGARSWPIIADSARPETISFLQRQGFRISPARKGPGSVEEGVNFLKAYDIVVHGRCRHTADELTNYSYKVDKYTNKVLPVLDDKKNHVIDAARYAVEDVRRAKGFFA